MACVLSEGSSPSVPMIFVAISISFSFLKAPVVRWVLLFCQDLRYDVKKKIHKGGILRWQILLRLFGILIKL